LLNNALKRKVLGHQHTPVRLHFDRPSVRLILMQLTLNYIINSMTLRWLSCPAVVACIIAHSAFYF